MRNWLKAGVAIAIVAAALACGKSDAQKQAEQAAAEVQKAAGELGKAAGAQGAADLAKAVEGVAAALSGGGSGKAVEPVSFELLIATLPQVSGWEMEKPRGERMSAPVSFSQTETTYRKGESEVEIKVVDTGFAQLLLAPWSMMMAMGYSKESTEGYEKATTVSGSPGFETWNKDDKHGELNFVVNKRFMVTVEGRDIADTKVLHEFASKMDLGKLPNE
jgi:hypothetical protein